ncbi:anti-sigma factor domain-containing protein [Marinoscillum sp. 108]|uniref:anti-sigma factor n=1 Tax=Marinoscillum sp. 108 TaxID=2653151 RepID=UPI0012F17746|nr:anti-sigma factor [Marinoscillum sp. 108]VXD16703.1 conserved hypothetical protein [Marinoscillum sp. 108]
MNKQEILTGGYLAAYITGELSADEEQEIETHIASDQQVRREYFDLQKTLELVAFHHSIAPSPVVKKFVMQNESVIKNIHSPGESSGGSRYLMAASITVALISALSAFYFWNQWKDTDSRLALLTARNIEMAESYQRVNQELTGIRGDLAVLVSPEFSRIILNGTDNATDAKAVIYWNPTEEEVYLNSANLAQLPQNQQYQLWALIDGVPVDAGVFDASDGTFQIMKNIARADAFAVTIEQSGGSESPTLSTMQVYGES